MALVSLKKNTHENNIPKSPYLINDPSSTDLQSHAIPGKQKDNPKKCGNWFHHFSFKDSKYLAPFCSAIVIYPRSRPIL
jgi:hypothetical protein